MPEIAYVNGLFCPIAEATVSVEDRGFQFADGVYEVVLFRGARPLFLEDHLARLRNSCREIDLDVDLDRLGLESLIRDGVRQAELPETMVYVQLTRGSGIRNHIVPQGLQATVVMTFRPRPQVPATRRTNGITVMTVPDDRWGRCHIKSIALLPNVLAKNAAVRAGYDDALFVGSHGEVREAAAANVFAVRAGTLLTPPRDHSILPGITRNWILACAARIDLPIGETALQLPELLTADEVFLCSTTIDLLSVVRIDEHAVGTGTPGPVARKIYEEMLRDLEG